MRLHQDLLQSQALDWPGARCTRLDWTAHYIQSDQTVDLINQHRFGRQGKSKDEQVRKVKQIESDDAKQEVMDQTRQDSAKQDFTENSDRYSSKQAEQ